jgi:hypothetical protein
MEAIAKMPVLIQRRKVGGTLPVANCVGKKCVRTGTLSITTA